MEARSPAKAGACRGAEVSGSVTSGFGFQVLWVYFVSTTADTGRKGLVVGQSRCSWFSRVTGVHRMGRAFAFACPEGGAKGLRPSLHPSRHRDPQRLSAAQRAGVVLEPAAAHRAQAPNVAMGTRETRPLQMSLARPSGLSDFEAQLQRNRPIRDAFSSPAVADAIAPPDTTYGCYLISLEGQLGALPAPGDVQDAVGQKFVYEELAEAYHSMRPAGGLGAPQGLGTPPPAAPEVLDVVMRWSISTHHREARVRVEEESGWQATHRPDEPAPRLVELGSGAAGAFVVDYLDPELWDSGARQLRFPVLAHWTFRTEGAADFQALMENLDVGCWESTRPARTRWGSSTPATRSSSGSPAGGSPPRRGIAARLPPGRSNEGRSLRRCSPPSRRCGWGRTAVGTCPRPRRSRSGGCWRCLMRRSSASWRAGARRASPSRRRVTGHLDPLVL